MTRGALGFGNWIYAAIFSDSSLHRNAQDFVRVSIKANESDNTVHKGRKPSEFIAWLIGLFTKRGDSVIDPFLGSGTTLLVAETMGRICYGGEINPEFCAEIIARWETMTGLRAEVIARGAHALRTG
jgi:DNA modification methylase